MRILVLADTHMPCRGRALPDTVQRELAGADLVVHLGDFTDMEVATAMEAHAPLCAVHGNNDSGDVRARIPAARRLTVEGFTLVLIHGDVGGQTAVQAARRVTGADAVLFGHSHQPHCEWEGGRLLFNPGSPTDRRRAPYRSFGVIEVAGALEPHIVPLTDALWPRVDKPCGGW